MYPNTALILEGGAVRGVFTSGVLDYLMEQNFYLPYVVGVSAGACNAVDYLSKQVGRTRDCTIIKEKQYQYFNLKKTLKNRSLFDMDMIFDRFPNEIYPFDYETYFQSDMLCELVVTNCLTGRAMYLTEKQNKERLMTICRASSSIPIASPMVSVDGIPCLDGGLSDSIPLLHTMRNGCRKNVVVLTRATARRFGSHSSVSTAWHTGSIRSLPRRSAIAQRSTTARWSSSKSGRRRAGFLSYARRFPLFREPNRIMRY